MRARRVQHVETRSERARNALVALTVLLPLFVSWFHLRNVFAAYQRLGVERTSGLLSEWASGRLTGVASLSTFAFHVLLSLALVAVVIGLGVYFDRDKDVVPEEDTSVRDEELRVRTESIERLLRSNQTSLEAIQASSEGAIVELGRVVVELGVLAEEMRRVGKGVVVLLDERRHPTPLTQIGVPRESANGDISGLGGGDASRI